MKGTFDRIIQNQFSYLFLVLFCLCLYLPGIKDLSPFDRDESRYVQATKQMIETGNYTDIRFQALPRYSKPIGIYWLQSLSIHFLSGSDTTALWAYRIPSIAGAIGSVLLLYFFGKYWFSRTTSFLAAMLLASCILLIAEAHLAKTDSFLLFILMLSQGFLGIIYIKKTNHPRLCAMIFWCSMAIGILIKGPIVPLIAGTTIFTLIFIDKKRGWLKDLHFIPGIVLSLLIAVPWFWQIHQISGNTFWNHSFQKDFMAKLLSAQESHGAYPGYFVLTSFISFFPASIFIIPSLIYSFRYRKNRGTLFCLAWIVPNWIVLELIPTKLPHYVLPLFPALALLIANTLLTAQEHLNDRRLILAAIFGISLFALSSVLVIGTFFFAQSNLLPLISLIPIAMIAYAGFFWIWKHSWISFAFGISCLMAVFSFSLFIFTLPNFSKLWVSKSIAQKYQEQAYDRVPSKIILIGFSEPSAVFLLGTNISLMSPREAIEMIAESKKENEIALAIVERTSLKDLEHFLNERNLSLPDRHATVSGFNYSKGREVELGFYLF